MITKIDLKDKRVLAFKIERHISADELKDVFNQMKKEMKSTDEVRLYVEMYDLSGMDPSAVWEDLRFAFNNMSEMNEKIEKVAFVAKSNWLRLLAMGENILFPNIDERAFTLEQKQEALDWIKK